MFDNTKMKVVGNVNVYFNSNEMDTFEMINSTVHLATELIKDKWGLSIPDNSRIYVMNNWLKFLFQSAPLYYWPIIGLNLPFVFPMMKKSWGSVGGWAKRYGKRHVIGIKDKQLINLEGSELGKKIFIPETTIEDKMKHIITHELTHVCLSNYKKPEWFNEGMAMLAVDKIFQKQTVRKDTLDLLAAYNIDSIKKSILSNYIVGYWFVKYLDEKEPETLKRILSHQNMYEDVWIKELSISIIEYKDKVVKHFESY